MSPKVDVISDRAIACVSDKISAFALIMLMRHLPSQGVCLYSPLSFRSSTLSLILRLRLLRSYEQTYTNIHYYIHTYMYICICIRGVVIEWWGSGPSVRKVAGSNTTLAAT